MIKLENVSKLFYRGRRELIALDNVNIELPNKGMTFIVGENGAGKSTLASIIAGLDKPTKGKVYYNDINYNDINMSLFRSNTISFVFQEVNLLEDFNVYDNLKIALKLSGKEVSEDKINSVLSKLNIGNLGSRFKHELSIGQMQRVAIARAILKDAKILICDEGTSALDEQNAMQVYEILKELSNDRLVIVITHDINIVNEYSENVIYLKKGRVEKGVNIHSKVKIKDEIRERKSIFKYGYKLFLKRKKSLIIASILSTISLFFLSLIFNLYLFNPEKYYLKKIDSENIKYVNIDYFGGVDEKYLIHTFSVNEGKIYSLKFYDKYLHSNFYEYSVNGIMNLSEEELHKLGHKMMVGSLPGNDNDDAIAITDFMFYQYRDLGLIDANNNEISIKNANDVLNKKIYFNGREFYISGVVDTGFNWKRYEFLRDFNSGAHERCELTTIKSSTLANFYFVNQNNISNMGENNSTTFLLTENKQLLKDVLYNGNKELNITSIVDCYLYSLNGLYHEVVKYLKYAVIAISIFNILILYLLVNENISVRNNDIALLKSLGANNREIFKMFYFENVLLSVFLSVISSIICIPLNYLANVVYLETKPLMNIFELTYFELFVFVVFLIVISFVSTVLGVLKNRNKYMPLSLFKK